ncbi:ankyrin repeat domain-containing protein [Wolbachia endosymbiont of Psylliodes chrysocephala]|uniref:ankyrin repeat domain-containing protein n=1 Tax=Wolbachia endosymbiont of Psylliodes chrysocephala TaxID=2883236 RepID=UPI00209E1790|nr:ankyrin repeat domain-containing protein [Wolbachia endosymbiont of Psylliodes chrysocephala]
MAFKYKRFEMVNYLIEDKGFTLENFYPQIAIANASLRMAVQNGYNGLFTSLLGRGADVNAKDPEGVTFLHVAAQYNREDMARLLLREGADVNATTSNGNTPLHLAVMAKKEDVAKLLLYKGADINAKNNDGLTPLDLKSIMKGETRKFTPKLVQGLKLFYSMKQAGYDYPQPGSSFNDVPTPHNLAQTQGFKLGRA